MLQIIIAHCFIVKIINHHSNHAELKLNGLKVKTSNKPCVYVCIIYYTVVYIQIRDGVFASNRWCDSEMRIYTCGAPFLCPLL